MRERFKKTFQGIWNGHLVEDFIEKEITLAVEETIESAIATVINSSDSNPNPAIIKAVRELRKLKNPN